MSMIHIAIILSLTPGPFLRTRRRALIQGDYDLLSLYRHKQQGYDCQEQISLHARKLQIVLHFRRFNRTMAENNRWAPLRGRLIFFAVVLFAFCIWLSLPMLTRK